MTHTARRQRESKVSRHGIGGNGRGGNGGSGSGGGGVLSSDTQALCQRLEKKIENLTKFGSGLHKENQGKVLFTNLFIH